MSNFLVNFAFFCNITHASAAYYVTINTLSNVKFNGKKGECVSHRRVLYKAFFFANTSNFLLINSYSVIINSNYALILLTKVEF